MREFPLFRPEASREPLISLDSIRRVFLISRRPNRGRLLVTYGNKNTANRAFVKLHFGNDFVTELLRKCDDGKIFGGSKADVSKRRDF